MPPVPKNQRYPGKRLLALQCKWQECNETLDLPIDDYQDFSEHVFGHVSNYLTNVGFSQHDISSHVTGGEDNSESSLLTKLTCRWSECDWEVRGNPDEFSRHALFHAYHAKLKCLGAFAIILDKLRQCTFEVETSDLLPDLSEPFVCKWEGCETQFLCPDKFYRHVDLHGQAAHREDVLVTTGEQTKLETATSTSSEFDGLKVQTMTQSVCRWEGCSYLARDPWKIKEHCRIHTGEKLIACPSCGLFFASKTKFSDHLIRQDTTQYEHFQCSHCLTRCASERLLRDHMRHHVNHVKCPHCDMTCPNPSTLRGHLKFKHSMDRPFKCSMCNYSCKTKHDLTRHEGSIHFNRKFYCDQEGCSFECRYAAALRSHMKSVHQGVVQQYMCHICGKTLSRGTLLTKHLKKDHCFSWPSGHSRFRYKLDGDGYYRLQMVRFESAELTEQLSRENPDNIDGYRDGLVSNDSPASCNDTEKSNSPAAQTSLVVNEVLPARIHAQVRDAPRNEDISTLNSANKGGNETVSVSLNDRYEKLLRLYEMSKDNEVAGALESSVESRGSGALEALSDILGRDDQDCYSNRSKRKNTTPNKSTKRHKSLH